MLVRTLLAAAADSSTQDAPEGMHPTVSPCLVRAYFSRMRECSLRMSHHRLAKPL
jgi:hypothetical protein